MTSAWPYIINKTQLFENYLYRMPGSHTLERDGFVLATGARSCSRHLYHGSLLQQSIIQDSRKIAEWESSTYHINQWVVGDHSVLFHGIPSTNVD